MLLWQLAFVTISHVFSLCAAPVYIKRTTYVIAFNSLTQSRSCPRRHVRLSQEHICGFSLFPLATSTFPVWCRWLFSKTCPNHLCLRLLPCVTTSVVLLLRCILFHGDFVTSNYTYVLHEIATWVLEGETLAFIIRIALKRTSLEFVYQFLFKMDVFRFSFDSKYGCL